MSYASYANMRSNMPYCQYDIEQKIMIIFGSVTDRDFRENSKHINIQIDALIFPRFPDKALIIRVIFYNL